MTEIEEIVNSTSFTVYPNPATDFIQINYAIQNDATCKVTIQNALGQIVAIVYEGSFYAGENTFDYSTSLLESGVYFISVESEGTKETLKFIKN